MKSDSSENTQQANPAGGEKIKVLYLAGWGHSGTTLIANILGEVSGFVSVGEITNLWQRGGVENKVCGCGQPFWSCEFWPAVFQDAFGNQSPDEAAHINELRNHIRNLDILRSWLPNSKKAVEERVNAYSSHVEKLFTSIKKITNCSVIVDTSKIPIDAYCLASIPNIELYILHIVRNPYAVAYSYMQKRLYDPSSGDYMEQHTPFSSTLIWSAWNLGVELLLRSKGHYLRVSYEDFVQKPEAALQNILNLLDEHPQKPLIEPDGVVSLSPNHNVAGNPVRFSTGQVTLKMDNRWKTQMRWRDKAVITTFFYPFLVRYGY